MKGEAPVRVLLPHEDVGKRRKATTRRTGAREVPENVDTELFERLRETRLQLAKERGVPAYVVCHDRTLLELAAIKPSSVEALAEIHGMGPARISSYGEPFLATVRAH
jgi:ATP-dependent DNA helicase RecQ